MRIFGLDLGISSIGWAVVEEKGKEFDLLNWGSRIFEPGMDGSIDDIQSGKGKSLCTNRRLKRALRVQYRRRRERREKIIALLTEFGLLPSPLTPAFFTEIDKRLLMTFPKEMRPRVAHVLPYLYRKKALDQPLRKDELGRALFHLAQRRGYKSNRKVDLKDSEETGVVQSDIDKLKADMAKAGARTLGEFFCTVDPEEERIRTRYTDRGMFEQELAAICKAQRHLVSEAQEERLAEAFFFQRKLKSNAGLVGACSIYPEEKRCSYKKEEAQRFRIYTTLNHLRIRSGNGIRQMTGDERTRVLNTLDGFSPLMTAKGTVPLSKLAKAAMLPKGEKFTLTDEGEKEIPGNELKAILRRVFGDRAEKLTSDEQQAFLHDLDSIEKSEILEKRLKGHWNLAPEQVDAAMRTALPDGYCAYSLKALKELLPDLEAGIPLATVQKANYPHIVSDALDELPLLDLEGSLCCNPEIGHALRNLRNPIVHRVLTELRRVVNALVARYGKPDMIRLELARDLKSTNKERERITKQNFEREKERAAIAAKIAKEAGIEKPSKNDILKVMLAEECNYTCPYTGKPFSMYDLLHGKSIHIEHIIPFSRSFDDSFRNKTLCEASANSAKNNKTPFEAFAGSEKYQEILERVRHFTGTFADKKLELFELETVDSDGFLERELNDTRYASKIASQYLALLYGGLVDPAGKRRIFTVSGGCTAMIRRAWGGNYLLGEGEKVRADHRHHAIDALTIAITDPSMIKTIAGMTPEERRARREAMKPLLENTLYLQAKEKLASCAVSHHMVNKIRGALHKETIYSKDYGDGQGVRHERVPLADLALKDIPKIVDPAIRAIVEEKLGICEGNDAPPDLKIFKDPANLPVLKDASGKAVNTIKKVRVLRTQTTRTIGEGDRKREVANGANYLLAVFARLDGNGNETAWEGEIVSLMDAVLRKQAGKPLFEKDKPGLKFKFTLRKGDIVTICKDGKDLTCIIRGISLPQFSMTPVADARKQKDLKSAKVWFTPTLTAARQWNLRKVRQDLFGELRRAND